jgi:hypothetical protein
MKAACGPHYKRPERPVRSVGIISREAVWNYRRNAISLGQVMRCFRALQPGIAILTVARAHLGEGISGLKQAIGKARKVSVGAAEIEKSDRNPSIPP